MVQLHRVWKLGADIDTDVLAPGAYMRFGVDKIAEHCLEGPYPGLAAQIKVGDVLVAGPNFGIGSSREQAVAVLTHLGIKAVIAPSFSGLYFRNAYTLGLLALECPEAEAIPPNACIALNLNHCQILVFEGPDASQESFRVDFTPVPEFLLEMVHAGGLLKQLEQEYAASGNA
ncbi:MAG TPA: 3-isopropylmalate dehydratase [Paenalcaligenes sp.]|nr:3-isopropylmalate dehydratase [Paenalcaligenes sp.]